MKESDVKNEGREQRDNKRHFKKKGGNKNKGKRQQSAANDLGIGFSLRRTIERLGLYVITHFKNWSDVKVCLKEGKMIRTAYPDSADEHNVH